MLFRSQVPGQPLPFTMSQMESDLCQHDNTLGKSKVFKSAFRPHNNRHNHSSCDSGKRSSANRAKKYQKPVKCLKCGGNHKLIACRKATDQEKICGKPIEKPGPLLVLPNPQIPPTKLTTPNNKSLQPRLQSQLTKQLNTRHMQLFLRKILKRKLYTGPLWHKPRTTLQNDLNCLNG